MTDHLEGMKYCLKLIEELRKEYESLGFTHDMLSIDRVLSDVENKIGERAIKDWRRK